MKAALSQAWQSWKATPGVALLAIVAFAVGIGSATAIFTVVNGVMLRPLPYPQGERFVTLLGANPNEPGRYSTSNFPDLLEYQRQTTSFDAFGWFKIGNFNLTAPGDPQFVAGTSVTPALVRQLGEPALGQWFVDERGAVLSSVLWRRLGSDPDIVGKAITLDERTLTVTGVMPAGFRLPLAGTTPGRSETDVWVALDPLGRGENPTQGIFFAYARRKPGISLEQADADVKRVAAEIVRLAPASHRAYTAEVHGLRESVFSNLRSMLLILFAAAGLLLLISCANVATLLLARSVARARETAIRVALGASRRQLAFRYFVEGGVVSVIGAAASFALSLALVRVIVTAGAEYIPYADEIAVDWNVFAFAVLMAFVASGLASLAPLWQAIRLAPNAVLTAGVRASAGAHVRRLSHALIVGEVALAFTLLTVAAILGIHLRDLSRVAPGFDTDDLLTFEVTVPQQVMSSEDRAGYQQRLIDALREVPGVSSAAFSNQLPLAGCCLGGTIHPEGRPPMLDARRVSFVFTTPDYLTAMRIPLRAGRFLTASDTSDDILFAAVNQTAANIYWPDRDPVGAYGRLNQPDGNRFQVVGVVGDVRNDGLASSPAAELYLLASLLPVNPMAIVVRSEQPPERLLGGVRRAVQGVGRTLVVHDVRTMNEIMRDSLQLERVSSLVMLFFAVTAVLMATLGVYGVLSYAVRQRTVEVGTRMALGAVSRHLLVLIVGSGLKMAGAGVAIGAVALVGAVWALREFMDVRTVTSLPFVSSAAIVAVVAAAASYAPAWRATRLPPIVAIRDERTSAWRGAGRRLQRTLDHVRQAVSAADVAPALSATMVLSDFVDAARTAESYHGALQQVLASLCAKLDIRSALLLERTHGGLYRRSVALGRMDAAIQTLPGEGFLAQRLQAYPLPLPFVAGELGMLIEWAEGNRPGRVDEIRSLAAADVRLAVPLRTRTETIGVLLLGPAGDRASYSSDEKHVLRACADQFALMLENGHLTDRVVEQETVRRDLALAVEVQQRLLPTVFPSEPFAEFAAISVPARSIGGDYYDFIQTCEHQVGIAIADVSGKGIAAALIMSVVQASLRIVTAGGNVPLPRLAATLNAFLYRSTPASKYATFFYAQVDSARAELRYVNAGHNPPYLFRPMGSGGDAGGGDVEELSIGGMVVGMFPEAEYEEGVVDLRTGDVLVAFTDGVPEAHDPEGEEFGEERLKRLVRAATGLPAAEITTRISTALKDWIQDAEQYDDLTVVVMRVN